VNSSVVLRTASGLSLLFALGHTLGSRRSWSPVGENAVLEAMRSVRFQVGGVSRSFLDFYLGFGFLLSVYLVLQAVLLWLLAGVARDSPQVTGPFVLAFTVANAACTVLCWRFLFCVPAVFTAVVTVTIGLALLDRRTKA
jgi:uncharacterized membrane protein